MVDLERFSVKKSGSGNSNNNSSSLIDDKDILVSIEEIETKKLKESSAAAAVTKTETNDMDIVIETSSSTVKPHKSAHVPIKSFPRPDVTWLRRTEYISAVRNSPSSTTADITSDPSNTEDNTKVLLANPVAFSSIVTAVNETFRAGNGNNIVHPINPQLKLEQSFPLIFDSKAEYAHCLFLGEYQRQNKNSDNHQDISILQINENDDSTTNNNNNNDDDIKRNGANEKHVTLFTGNDGNGLLKPTSDFDLMDVSANAKGSLVLFLPISSKETDDSNTAAAAKLVKINSNYSLKKRRCRLNPLKLKITRI